MGPRGDLDSDRAGELGEYHHSKNLMKNMAVGSKSRSESRSSWGDLLIRLLSRTHIPLPRTDGLDIIAALAALCEDS